MGEKDSEMKRRLESRKKREEETERAMQGRREARQLALKRRLFPGRFPREYRGNRPRYIKKEEDD